MGAGSRGLGTGAVYEGRGPGTGYPNTHYIEIFKL